MLRRSWSPDRGPGQALHSFIPVNAMKQPEHPAGPAFEQARDRIAFLENRLMEAQRDQYDEFVQKQKNEKEEQKRKAARAKAEYDQAKEKAPHLVKNYDPPIKIKDPYLRRMAIDAQAEHQKVTTLGHTQLEDKLRFLEKLDRQREKQAEFQQDAQRISRSRAAPEFARAATPERQRKTGQETNRPTSREQDSALTRAFEKARQQQEQSRQRTQSHEHGPNRDRERD